MCRRLAVCAGGWPCVQEVGCVCGRLAVCAGKHCVSDSLMSLLLLEPPGHMTLNFRFLLSSPFHTYPTLAGTLFTA